MKKLKSRECSQAFALNFALHVYHHKIVHVYVKK